MGGPEVAQFLTWLATRRHVSASTQNQALSTLVFMYREVLGKDLEVVEPLVRARTPSRLPVVLSRDEVRRVLAQLDGTVWIIAMLLYGGGLRLRECLELRVKDIDFGRRQIVVRRRKGRKDRVTPLPASVRERLAAQLGAVRRLHDNAGRVLHRFRRLIRTLRPPCRAFSSLRIESGHTAR